MPVVVATLTPKEGQIDAVVDALRELIPAVHAEDGCERYALHRNDAKLVFVEQWRDMAALAAHGSGESMRRLGERLSGLLAGDADIQVLEPVPAGDPHKGAL